jgi:hypothetical protein
MRFAFPEPNRSENFQFESLFEMVLFFLRIQIVKRLYFLLVFAFVHYSIICHYRAASELPCNNLIYLYYCSSLTNIASKLFEIGIIRGLFYRPQIRAADRI